MKKTLIVTKNIVGDDEYKYQNIETLILQEGVEYIGKFAFCHNSIKKLYLPKSVKKVDDFAFLGNDIEELIFHNNDVTFGEKCFCCSRECYFGYVSEYAPGGFEIIDSSPLLKLTIIGGNYKTLYDIFSSPYLMKSYLYQSIQGNYNPYEYVREINIVNNNIGILEILKIIKLAISYRKIKVNIIRNNIDILTYLSDEKSNQDSFGKKK